MTKEIKIQVWDTVKKEMSLSMPLPMLAGYLHGIYPNLGNEIYREFTGLKDKNGVEIYEGDILRLMTHYPHDFQERNPHKKHGRIGNGVKYSLEYGAFLLDDTFEKEPFFCGFKENEQWEVIGNIYQNPELLK